MMEKNTLQQKINAIKDYTFEVLDSNSEVNVYTTISKVYRIEKNIEKIIKEDQIENIDFNCLRIANYIINIEQAKNKSKTFDFKNAEISVGEVVREMEEKFELESEIINKVKTIVIESFPFNEPQLLEAKIISDANIMDFACNQGRDRLKQMYEQMILKDLKFSKRNWYDVLINILESYKTTTNFGQTVVQPKINKLYKSLKKERKALENQNNLILQKELKISDEEIKKLKKDLGKIKGRDDRGIQTLFRNTSRNHYTLNRMVDAKASIMITVNSIILSLILSGIIGKSSAELSNDYVPSIIFSIVNLLSITFAIISIAPNKTQGNFTEEEIRSKKGNLLYFGNFHNMQYRDFEWAFLQMLQDKDYLYTSMIRDFYYQSQILHRKYVHLRLSLYIFLFGLGVAILSHFLIYWT
ncbi:Pycsar system effector family protein [Mariniflexile ostreae]|uniref:Pycsar system effector family protein n=1 Tax=Mariniflexile ostreae TaxID=1520892 RepID=A0ABV5FBE0_9FLAO